MRGMGANGRKGGKWKESGSEKGREEEKIQSTVEISEIKKCLSKQNYLQKYQPNNQNPYEIYMCGKYQWKNLVTLSL